MMRPVAGPAAQPYMPGMALPQTMGAAVTVPPVSQARMPYAQPYASVPSPYSATATSAKAFFGGPAAVPQTMQPQRQMVTPQAQPGVPVVTGPPAKPPPPPEAATCAVDHDLQVGDWVRFTGIAHNPEYEGKSFCVEVPNVGDGRVRVSYQPNPRIIKKLYFDPSTLEKTNQAPQEFPVAVPSKAALPTTVAPVVSNFSATAPTINTAPTPTAPSVSGRVRVVGLGTPHTGKLGWVVRCTGSVVCVQLEAEDGSRSILELPSSYVEELGDTGETAPPNILEAVEAAAAPPVAAQQESLPGCNLTIGESVKIVKLAARPHYQGRSGKVDAFKDGQVLVKFDEVGQDGVIQLALNPAYLQSLDNPDASPGGFNTAQLASAQLAFAQSAIPGVAAAGAQPAAASHSIAAGASPTAALLASPLAAPLAQFQAQAAQAQVASNVPEGGYQQGDRVRVNKGLAARPQFIGKTGIVESTSADGDILIKFDDPSLGAVRLNLKPQHLEPC